MKNSSTLMLPPRMQQSHARSFPSKNILHIRAMQKMTRMPSQVQHCRLPGLCNNKLPGPWPDRPAWAGQVQTRQIRSAQKPWLQPTFGDASWANGQNGSVIQRTTAYPHYTFTVGWNTGAATATAGQADGVCMTGSSTPRNNHTSSHTRRIQ